MRFVGPAVSRRRFTAQLLQASAAVLTARAQTATTPAGPGIRNGTLPSIAGGVMSGDVTTNSAVLWSRADRPARLWVEWSTTESFSNPRVVSGPLSGPDADYTAKLELTNLPPGERIFYRARFENPDGRGRGEPVVGQFVTAPTDSRSITFAWSGDTCGQGYGTSPDRRGMKTYAALREARPDFFIHSGDTVYADNPILESVTLADGSKWQNWVMDEKTKVAESLDEFRASFRYNLADEHVRAFNATTPILAQWDDHEVRNNWYPGQTLESDPRYREKDVNVLSARARQAFFDYQPVAPRADSRIYRVVPRGPLCDLFFIDLRSYRGPNSANRQPQLTAESAILGHSQLNWLKESLLASRATWKVICSDMPLALLVGDGKDRWEAFANGDSGIPAGRELEVADLLSFLKAQKIRNVIWLTADVHYAASHYYDPAQAKFTDFDPFWEFVSGPLHAGTFGPNSLDGTFGPVARWTARPSGSAPSGPYSLEQYFGQVHIDGRTRVATVSHHNRDGTRLWSLDLPPN
ncbi:MAG: alkaline phosphatase D family protein [Verrucomicrobia bacterium]|nr:alkaline phosphatase D family protein [Verrucomicrobiota bacterium]